MRIGDAASAAGLTPRALRYYEERGFLSAHRAPSGHRAYTSEDVERLRIVRDLMAVGFTIADVRTLVEAITASPPAEADLGAERGESCPVPAGVIRDRLNQLDQHIERLTDLRDALASRAGEPLREFREHFSR